VIFCKIIFICVTLLLYIAIYERTTSSCRLLPYSHNRRISFVVQTYDCGIIRVNIIVLQTNSYMCTNISCTTNLRRFDTCYSNRVKVYCLRYTCLRKIMFKVICTSINSIIILTPLLWILKPIKLMLCLFYIEIIFSAVPRNIYFDYVFSSFCSKNLK
jgi:hypothetical protein